MRTPAVSVRTLTSLIVLLPVLLNGAQDPNRWRKTAPETFSANASITAASGGTATSLSVHIDKYTPDAEHQALVTALTGSTQAAFLDTLKQAAPAGTLKIGDRSFTIRWARERIQGDRRRIIAVTDAPIFFFGAGAVDAKPTEGYDLGVVEFTVDSIGLGKGTMAAAAKVKPGGPTGVQVDDYSGKRIELLTVRREQSKS